MLASSHLSPNHSTVGTSGITGQTAHSSGSSSICTWPESDSPMVSVPSPMVSAPPSIFSCLSAPENPGIGTPNYTISEFPIREDYLAATSDQFYESAMPYTFEDSSIPLKQLESSSRRFFNKLQLHKSRKEDEALWTFNPVESYQSLLNDSKWTQPEDASFQMPSNYQQHAHSTTEFTETSNYPLQQYSCYEDPNNQLSNAILKSTLNFDQQQIVHHPFYRDADIPHRTGPPLQEIKEQNKVQGFKRMMHHNVYTQDDASNTCRSFLSDLF